MSQPRIPKLSPVQLRKAYKQDLAAAWAMARRKHPDDTPYAFVLYGLEGGQPPQFTPCLLTEQSLTVVAKRYLEGGYYDALDEARNGLRYSVADSPLFSELEGSTPNVDAVVAPHAEVLDDDTGYALLARAAMAALRELDADGLFGTGTERERLLLIIITEDTPHDWSTESARELNPPAVFQRFEADTKVEGTFASSRAIAVSSDGGSLYSAGSRNIPDAEAGDDDSLSGVVAYQINGRKLARRWAFEFPAFGDSIRPLACHPDGRSILALRATYVDKGCQSIVLRFPSDSNKPVQEHRLVGEPAGFAVSRDGSRVVVALHDKTLHVFDADLRPLGVREFDAKVYSPLFLGTGELLLATERAVLRLDLARDEPLTVAAAIRSLRLFIDIDETLLAVARGPALSGPERENPKEFGVVLLRLPSFDPVRTFLVPGHQAIMPALSPDGPLIAFEAHEIGKARKFVVVFEIGTGREIARRKSDLVNALAFLPDNRTLAIASSEFTTTEPIELWVPAAT